MALKNPSPEHRITPEKEESCQALSDCCTGHCGPRGNWAATGPSPGRDSCLGLAWEAH